jgi:hypothetical protein
MVFYSQAQEQRYYSHCTLILSSHYSLSSIWYANKYCECIASLVCTAYDSHLKELYLTQVILTPWCKNPKVQHLIHRAQTIRPGPRLCSVFSKRHRALRWWLLAPAQPPSWRTTHCRLSANAYSIYSQYLEAVSSIRNPRTRHAVVTVDPLNMHVSNTSHVVRGKRSTRRTTNLYFVLIKLMLRM